MKRGGAGPHCNLARQGCSRDCQPVTAGEPCRRGVGQRIGNRAIRNIKLELNLLRSVSVNENVGRLRRGGGRLKQQKRQQKPKLGHFPPPPMPQPMKAIIAITIITSKNKPAIRLPLIQFGAIFTGFPPRSALAARVSTPSFRLRLDGGCRLSARIRYGPSR